MNPTENLSAGGASSPASLVRRFRVRGICLVPTEVEMEVEAENEEAAVKRALRSDWKMHMGANDADFRSAFDWRPSAEEISSANNAMSRAGA